MIKPSEITQVLILLFLVVIAFTIVIIDLENQLQEHIENNQAVCEELEL